MPKRFVGFILLGIAGIDAVTTTLLSFLFFRLFSILGFSELQRRAIIGSLIVSTTIPVIILILSGIIVIIKSSKKDKKKVIRNGLSIGTLIDIMKYSFVDKIGGIIHIESIKQINEERGDEGYLLKLILSDELSSIKVIIEGAAALKMFNSIKEDAYVEFRNVPVRLNSETNEKELLFTKDSSFKVI
jgi:hypothetical protein